jgi:lysozyme
MSKNSKLITLGLAGALALSVPFVATYEGESRYAYLDPVDIPTICYGYTHGVKLGQTKTEEECAQLLVGELGKVQKAVDQFVIVPLPNFQHSTVLKKINAGDTKGGCTELSRWIYAGKKPLEGLKIRRAAERKLCELGL